MKKWKASSREHIVSTACACSEATSPTITGRPILSIQKENSCSSLIRISGKKTTTVVSVAIVTASPTSPAPSTAKEDEAALRAEAAARREAEAAAAVREAAAADRRRALGDAFGKGEGDASTFAAEALRGFSAEVLTVARAQPALVAHLETTLDAFLSGGKRREAMPPMPRSRWAWISASHAGWLLARSQDERQRGYLTQKTQPRLAGPALATGGVESGQNLGC